MICAAYSHLSTEATNAVATLTYQSGLDVPALCGNTHVLARRCMR